MNPARPQVGDMALKVLLKWNLALERLRGFSKLDLVPRAIEIH